MHAASHPRVGGHGQHALSDSLPSRLAPCRLSDETQRLSRDPLRRLDACGSLLHRSQDRYRATSLRSAASNTLCIA